MQGRIAGGSPYKQARRRIVNRREQRRESGVRSGKPGHSRLLQTTEVRGRVERPGEPLVRAIAWHVDEVGIPRRGEGGQCELAQGAPNSVGDLYDKASER